MSNTTILVPMEKEDLIDISLYITDKMLKLRNEPNCSVEEMERMAELVQLLTKRIPR